MNVTVTRRWASVLVAVGMIVTGIPTDVEAQQGVRPPQQVISANPFGLLLGLFNAEYERKVSASTTAGVGGSSFLSDDDDDYINADVFYRYYPSGRLFEGFAFGVKMGVTKAFDEGTFFGVGFDTNWSWLMGRNDNFYVGVGVGLKRLFGTSESDFDPKFIPTVRIVTIGFAF